MRPACCTSSAPDPCLTIPHENSPGTPNTALDSGVPAKPALDTLGGAAVFASSAKPGFGPPGLLTRPNDHSRAFGHRSILLLKAAATDLYRIRTVCSPFSAPLTHGTFPLR